MTWLPFQVWKIFSLVKPSHRRTVWSPPVLRWYQLSNDFLGQHFSICWSRRKNGLPPKGGRAPLSRVKTFPPCRSDRFTPGQMDGFTRPWWIAPLYLGLKNHASWRLWTAGISSRGHHHEIDGVKCEPFERVQIDTPEEYQRCHYSIPIRTKGYMLDMQMAEMDKLVWFSLYQLVVWLVILQSSYLWLCRLRYHEPPLINTSSLLFRWNWVATVVPSFPSTKVRPPLTPSCGLKSVVPFLSTQEQKFYEGMIIGENARENDLGVNITTAKQMTNVRSCNQGPNCCYQDATHLDTRRVSGVFGWWWVHRTVTPVSIRLLKQILNKAERDKAKRKKLLNNK